MRRTGLPVLYLGQLTHSKLKKWPVLYLGLVGRVPEVCLSYVAYDH